MAGSRRNDPQPQPEPTAPAPAEAATGNIRDDDEDIPNREFAENVRKALNVGTNREAAEQLAPYFAGLAKPS